MYNNQINNFQSNSYNNNSNLTSIITLSYNQLKFTEQFVNSILNYTKVPFELIIIDNGSDYETLNYLRNLETNDNVTIIYNTKNSDIAKSINQGLLEAKGNYVVFAENDIIVTKNWLSQMIEIAESNPNIGIVGPMSNAVSGIQIDINANYKTLDEMHKYAEDISVLNRNQKTEFPRVALQSTLVKKEVIDKIGGLDERFSYGYFTDDDFCLRVELSGYKTIIAKDVFVHHSATNVFEEITHEQWQEIEKINTELFVDKWGGNLEEVWVKGKEVNERELKYPIHKDIFIQSLTRAFVNSDDQEFDLALPNLKTALENYDNSNKIGYENVTKEDLLNLAGSIALNKNKLELSKEYFEESLNLNPTSSQACYGLGEYFKQVNELEKSKTMLEWAIANDNNNQAAQQKLMEVNQALNVNVYHNSLEKDVI